MVFAASARPFSVRWYFLEAAVGFSRHGGSGFLDFGEVSDAGESIEIDVLRPEDGFVGEGDGVDEGIGEGEFVPDEEVCGGNGDVFVDMHQNAGEHGAGDFLGFFERALFESHFADFRDNDGGHDQVGQLKEDGTEVNGVGTVFEALKPSGGVENVRLHEEGWLEFAILFLIEVEWLLAFEKSDELFRGEDGADFDFSARFRELEPLSGF
jgi:hypothetical protein